MRLTTSDPMEYLLWVLITIAGLVAFVGIMFVFFFVKEIISSWWEDRRKDD